MISYYCKGFCSFRAVISHFSLFAFVEGFGGRGGGGGGYRNWNNDDSRSHGRDGNRDGYVRKDYNDGGPPMASRGGRGGYQVPPRLHICILFG